MHLLHSYYFMVSDTTASIQQHISRPNVYRISPHDLVITPRSLVPTTSPKLLYTLKK
jgi:hypothetical protein